MPETKVRYFELDDHIGVEPTHKRDPDTGEEVENPKAGELQAAGEWGVGVVVTDYVLIGEKVEAIKQIGSVAMQPIEGTRIYATDDEQLAMALAGFVGVCHEIDPPTKAQLKKARENTAASREGTPSETISETPAGEKE